MRHSRTWPSWTILTLSLGVSALATACRRAPDAGALDRLAEKRVRHEALWNRFGESVKEDPLLEDVLADDGQVMVGIRGPLLQRIGQEVARSYLDRVELDLPLTARVNADGEIKVKTKLGRMTAGHWKVTVLIQRVKGLLRAATPTVTLPAPDRLALSVPVTLERGEGAAAVHFEWDSAGLANAVCADFEVDRTIQGRVLPDAYTLKGGLVLAATDEAVLARPTLQDARFRLRFDLTAESWAKVEAALQEQADPGKCGLAMKAISSEDILAKLRAILTKGFDVPLPKSLLRTFSLPARLQRSVGVEGRHFALAVKPHALRSAHDVLWSSAEVQVSKKAPQ